MNSAEDRSLCTWCIRPLRMVCTVTASSQ